MRALLKNLKLKKTPTLADAALSVLNAAVAARLQVHDGSDSRMSTLQRFCQR